MFRLSLLSMQVTQNSLVRPVRLSLLLDGSSTIKPKGEGVLVNLPPLEPRPHAGLGVLTLLRTQFLGFWSATVHPHLLHTSPKLVFSEFLV